MKNLCCGEFFSLCMKERDDGKNVFMITNHEDCFIAFCFNPCFTDFFIDFSKTSVKISGLEKFKLLLISDCFYSGEFHSNDEDDMESSCINMNFDEQNINYFCFCCQKFLNSFSEELSHITCIDFF